MTYQYLTADTTATAKEKGGFSDQKVFKTAEKYGFDYLILTWKCSMVTSRTLNLCLNPSAITFSSTEMANMHGKLGEIMSKLP